jgi:dolichyl-diphosphooligosaccharide--protein glycosyltransferase
MWGWFAWRPESTILEGQPLLFPGGNFSLSVAWGNFTTGFFISFISLGILIHLIIKRGEADKTLLVVWSLLILLAALGMRRWAYYLVINVALLTAYLSWQVLQFAGFKEGMAEPVAKLEKLKTKKKAKPKKPQRGGFRITAGRVNMALGVIVVFFFSFFPNISPAIATASQARFAPDDAWCQSLSWLGENTPEPFGNPDFYYKLYEPPLPGESYKYPESAYGIMAWWDYGHWITRIAHRIPNSSPFQSGIGEVARFFSAQDETSANKIMDELDSKYVIIDHDTATTKFYAVATLAGSSREEFYDVYYQRQEGRLMPVQLFYPEYYRSLAVRLYNFDGGKATLGSCIVISYQEKVSREGVRYKEIINSQSFPTYEAAAAHIAKQKSGNYKIVGNNPFVSPVSLEGLKNYKLVYSSDARVMQPGIGMVSVVKIFEYVSSGE